MFEILTVENINIIDISYAEKEKKTMNKWRQMIKVVDSWNWTKREQERESDWNVEGRKPMIFHFHNKHLYASEIKRKKTAKIWIELIIKQNKQCDFSFNHSFRSSFLSCISISSLFWSHLFSFIETERKRIENLQMKVTKK